MENNRLFNVKKINKDIIAAKPPLLGIFSLWNACGLLKSSSRREPLKILLDNLCIIKNVKKHINVKIDNKLNSSDSLCITSFKPFIIFFKNINTN